MPRVWLRILLNAGLIAGTLAGTLAAGCQQKAAPKGEPATPLRDAGPKAIVGPRTQVLPPMRSMLPPEPVTPMPLEMHFVLLDAGKGARTALRYGGGGAARELVARAQITSHGYTDGTWTEPLAQAPVRDGFGISVETTAAGATLHLRGLDATVVEARATPAAVDAANGYVARWRALLAGRRADVTTDLRGRFRDAALLDDPTGANIDARDELVQRWLGLVVPVPDEPVAVGARWRVVSVLRAGGAVLKQTATYTLTDVAATGWTVAVEAERIGEPQDIAVPGVPGALGELVGLRRVVTGTLTVAKSDPLPVRGQLTSEVTSHARFRLPDGAITERVTEDQATIDLGPP